MAKINAFRLLEEFPVEMGGDKMIFIGGPCAVESWEICDEVAGELKRICDELGIIYIFKGSFDKANRSSIHAGRGVGMEKGLRILSDIREKHSIPVSTDVHETWQCEETAGVCDLIQIPAYLCRQTDLILAAAATGKAVNIKKGQFMAPWSMDNVVEKVLSRDNKKVILCERGSIFGYNRLVVDLEGMMIMRKFGYPVVFDATHSVQTPGSGKDFTGGDRDFAPILMRAGLSLGIDGIFAEVHPDPDHAVSDGQNQLNLRDMEKILRDAKRFDDLARHIFG